MKNYRIYICFIVLGFLMLLLYPREGKFQYDYQKGRPWVYETLISPIDFPILKTEAEMLSEKEDRASETIEYYSYDPTVAPVALDQFGHRAVDLKLNGQLTKEMYSHLNTAYDRGLAADWGNGGGDRVIFVKRDKRVVETPVAEVYDIDRIYTVLKADMAAHYPGKDLDSVATAIGLKSFIVPNLLFDETTTQLVHREAVNYISPTKGMVYAGQLIVSEYLAKSSQD